MQTPPPSMIAASKGPTPQELGEKEAENADNPVFRNRRMNRSTATALRRISPAVAQEKEPMRPIDLASRRLTAPASTPDTGAGLTSAANIAEPKTATITEQPLAMGREAWPSADIGGAAELNTLQDRANAAPASQIDRADITSVLNAMAKAKNVPKIGIELLAPTLKNIKLENEPKGIFPNVVNNMLHSAMDKMYPDFVKYKKNVFEAARLLGQSTRTTQALLIAQLAIERKSEGAYSSSKIALPHLVMLAKANDPEHVLLFAIVRNQASLGFKINDTCGAGGFAAEELGLMTKVKIRNVFETKLNPNHVSQSDLPKSAERERQGESTLLDPEDVSSTNEFVRTKKEGFLARVEFGPKNILTQTHFNVGASAQWPDSAKINDSGASAYGVDAFIGQTYDLDNASPARKWAIAARLLIENAVCLATCAAISTKGIGLADAGCDPIDGAHAVSILAKAVSRRALDAVVPPSKRGVSVSTTADPVIANKVMSQTSTIFPPLGGTDITVTGNVYAKLQRAHGGTADNKKDIWKDVLDQTIIDNSKKIKILSETIAAFQDQKKPNESGSRISSLDKEMKKIEESIDSFVTQITQRSHVKSLDFQKIQTELAPAINKLIASIDKTTVNIANNEIELKKGQDPAETKIISQKIATDKDTLADEIQQLKTLREVAEPLQDSIRLQGALIKGLADRALDLSEEFGKVQADKHAYERMYIVDEENSNRITNLKNELVEENNMHMEEQKGLQFAKRKENFNSDHAILKQKNDASEKKRGEDHDDAVIHNLEKKLNKVKLK